MSSLHFILFCLKLEYSEDLLDDEEKKELLGMKLTYENCGSFALNYYKKFIEKAKMECPPEIYVYFEDKAFITYCQYQESKFKKNNFFFL